MSITPLEYVQKEFAQLEDMSNADWLRKMQEFAVLQNSKINLEHIVEMTYTKNEKFHALNSAVTALYFSDKKDYANGLFGVVRHLAAIEYESLNDDVIKGIYYLLNSVS